MLVAKIEPNLYHVICIYGIAVLGSSHKLGVMPAWVKTRDKYCRRKSCENNHARCFARYARMNTFAEPLILYAVLFLRFLSAPVMLDAPLEFSASAAAARLVIHTIPSLALVWYLLLKVKSLREWGVALPGKKDIVPALVSLPTIALVGFATAMAARHLGGLPEAPRILPPTTIAPWAILVVVIFAGAYLEESFFRFYLLSKRDGAHSDSQGIGPMGLSPRRAVFVSTMLFALCHTYAGLWGFVNAAISGTALACVFLRTKSLHGVSLAHGFYNVLVFALGPA